MRIGVFGDTHNNLKNVETIVEIFNRVQVTRVVHTGDITQTKVLDVLAQLNAPLHGVYGNNDQERESLERSAASYGMELADGPLYLEWCRRRIAVVHDPRELESALLPNHELALHGHTHLYRCERVASTQVFNPGECAGMLSGRNAVGVVDLISLQCSRENF